MHFANQVAPLLSQKMVIVPDGTIRFYVPETDDLFPLAQKHLAPAGSSVGRFKATTLQKARQFIAAAALVA